MRVILPPPPVSQTHSAGEDGAQQILPSLVRRFDGIGFDCQLSQPEFEARAALDVKYASYWRGGKATKHIGAHFEVRTVQQRRLGMMTQALTDCEPPTPTPPPHPYLLSHPLTTTTTSSTVWNTLSSVTLGRQTPPTSCYTTASPPINGASIKGT